MISRIKKNFNRVLVPFILLIIGGSSCSSSSVKKKIVENSNIISVQKEFIQSGPSQKARIAGLDDYTTKFGLENISAVHLYAVDWNSDGHIDLVTLPDYYSSPQFYVGDGKGQFNKASYNPFDKVIRASFLNFFDFNKDGILDLLVATLNQKTELNKDPIRVFIGERKKKKIEYIEYSTAIPSLKMPVSSISLVDFNMDGEIDIYVGNWFDMSKSTPIPETDKFFLKEKGKVKWNDYSQILENENFYDQSLSIFPNARPTFGTSTCDLDQNGRPDILTASSSGHKNKLWLNLKEKGKFLYKDYGEQTQLDSDSEGDFSTLGGGNSYYMLCADYNNDGIFDVAKGELFHSYDSEARDRSSILTGSTFSFPPKFIRTEYHKDDGTGSWSQGDRRGIWADLNLDGYLDLIVENSGFPPKSRLIFFQQESDHSFTDLAQDLGVDILNPSGSIVIDADEDGRPDLFVGQNSIRNADIASKLYAFKNVFNLKNKKILKVILRGKKANYHGLGSTIKLVTNKHTYLRAVEYNYGGLPSQNQEGLWFGLEKDEIITNIEIRWPYIAVDKNGLKYPLRKDYKIKNFKKYKVITLSD